MLLFWAFVCDALWAEWRQSEQVTLQKDEPLQLVVKTDAARRLLEFSWTLYTDDTLVVFVITSYSIHYTKLYDTKAVR